MGLKKDFFSYEGFVLFAVAFLLILTISAISKSIVDNVNETKIDKEIKRTYMQWADNHGVQGKKTVDDYLMCLKYNGNKREVGNWFPDKKDCLFLSKDKEFIKQVVTNIKSLDVSEDYKMSAIGK